MTASSGIPTKFSMPWAENAAAGYINYPIPAASQSTAGRASLNDGFPQATMQTGGTPAFGQDFNGILKQITAWNQWAQMGGPVAWDSAFSTAIGGYPKGSIVMSAVSVGLFWLSTTDNNTTNPDSGGAGWVNAFANHTGPIGITANGSLTIPANVFYFRFHNVCGAGGGGGGSYGANSGGSGGGGSPYISGGFPVVQGDVIVFNIASATPGGSGGSNPAGAGTNGGPTTISKNGSVMVYAQGGYGGGAGTSALATTGGAPGTYSVASGVTSDVYPAGSGNLPLSVSGYVIASQGGAPGLGGMTSYGAGGASAITGQNGVSYGQGGGGGANGGYGGTGGSGHAAYSW